MSAYYNENDVKTAAWLRELIKAGLIADGEVDTRSIVDVSAGDVRSFAQCHFFAGIGGWSYALRLAGWSDNRCVWTGSCPCQPWSMAGAGEGTADPRHLWPAWFGLIQECRPPVVFGEQVASLDGLYWLDLVYDGLEAEDYAIGTVDLAGAGLGSPDIRSRLWFVADSGYGKRRRQGSEKSNAGNASVHAERCSDTNRGRRIPADSPVALITERDILRTLGNAIRRTPVGDDRCGCWDRNACGSRDGQRSTRELADTWANRRGHVGGSGEAGRLEHSDSGRSRRHSGADDRAEDEGAGGGEAARGVSDGSESSGHARELGHTDSTRRQGCRPGVRYGLGNAGGGGGEVSATWPGASGELGDAECVGRPSRRQREDESADRAVTSGSGFWSAADWLPCRDGKYRPVRPGSFPLAHGLPLSVGRAQPELQRLASLAGLDGASLKRAKANRVGRLRGYGNAIKPQVAAEFIKAYCEAREG